MITPISYIQHIADKRASLSLRCNVRLLKEQQDYPDHAALLAYVARDVRTLFRGKGVSIQVAAVEVASDPIKYAVTVTISRTFDAERSMPTAWQDFYDPLCIHKEELQACLTAAVVESFDKATADVKEMAKRVARISTKAVNNAVH